MKFQKFLFLTVLVCANFTYAQDLSELVKNTINTIGIPVENIRTELIAEKKLAQDESKSIIVLPEYSDFGDGYFALNSHILIVKNESAEILNYYQEDWSTNGWESDAIGITDISIDTAPYFVSEGQRAFGIRVSFRGSSQVNPYDYETLTLFLADKKTKSIHLLLKNLEVMTYHGEWNGDCVGFFERTKSILILQENKTNGYKDILIKSTFLEDSTFVNKNGDCIETERETSSQYLMTYQNGGYVKPGVKRPFDLNISIWGVEPYWSIYIHGNEANVYLPQNYEMEETQLLVTEQINNQGYTNEYVDTYVLKSKNGDELILVLTKVDEKTKQCACAYDMDEEPSDYTAYLYTHIEGEKRMFLGCANVYAKPISLE